MPETPPERWTMIALCVVCVAVIVVTFYIAIQL